MHLQMWNSQYYLKCIYSIKYRSAGGDEERRTPDSQNIDDMTDAHIRCETLSPNLWERKNTENTIGNCYQYAAIFIIEHMLELLSNYDNKIKAGVMNLTPFYQTVNLRQVDRQVVELTIEDKKYDRNVFFLVRVHPEDNNPQTLEWSETKVGVESRQECYESETHVLSGRILGIKDYSNRTSTVIICYEPIPNYTGMACTMRDLALDEEESPILIKHMSDASWIGEDSAKHMSDNPDAKISSDMMTEECAIDLFSSGGNENVYFDALLDHLINSEKVPGLENWNPNFVEREYNNAERAILIGHFYRLAGHDGHATHVIAAWMEHEESDKIVGHISDNHELVETFTITKDNPDYSEVFPLHNNVLRYIKDKSYIYKSVTDIYMSFTKRTSE